MNLFLKLPIDSLHLVKNLIGQLMLLTVFAGFSYAVPANSYNRAADVVVSGTVTSSEGESLPGVSVTIKGTNLGSATGVDGKYTLRVPTASEGGTLVFTYLGFITQEVPVNGRSVINVTLKEDVRALEEVVVIGYGTQKKGNITGPVATFNADNLDERPVARVDQAMVGQMAGVTVKQTTGTPGKGMSVQVRGTGSISAGNEPLYVIDGFPLSPARPDVNGNYATGNPLDNMNPNDIESIQVLKDASSAAIYGSRASNGVVLITTKRGKTGKPKITLNSYAGTVERSKKLDMLSGEQWIERATEMINAQWAASGAGRTASQSTVDRRQILNSTLAADKQLGPNDVNTSYMIDDRWAMPGYPGLRIIDWQDEGFRRGLMQNYQLSASGGTDAVNYFVSGNLADQEGMVLGMNYRSYSARANVEVNANSKLKFGLNISPTFSITKDPGVEGKDNILHQMVSMTPVQEDTMGVYVNVGNNGQYRWSTSPNSPISKLEETSAETRRFRTLATVFGEYKIINGLNLRSTLNLDNTDNRFTRYIPYTIQGALAARQSQLTQNTSGSFSSYRRQTFVNENTLSYNKVFNKFHDVSVLGGFSYNWDRFDNGEFNSNGGYTNSVITTLNKAAGITGTTTGTENVLLSYYGRVQYAFKSKYMFSGSVRRDGSSRFGQNSKWGLFPSASFGWRVKEEKFMEKVPVISDLKLRGSWGKAGNYNVGDYSSISTLANYNYTFNGVQVIGQAPNRVVNPDVSWEVSNTFNAGVDFGLISNRITGSFDVYRKDNSNLLLNIPVPQTTGFTTLLGNTGEVRNKGWELELTSRNYTGSFQWTTTANLSHNTNKVLSLPGGQTQILIPSSLDIEHSILKVGEPLYSINVVRQIGILSQADITAGAAMYGTQSAGDPKYFDANNDGVINANDRVIVGHPTPDYTWGITNSFRYKGFDLSVLVQGQNGGSIYSLFGRSVNRTGTGFLDNVLGTWANRWRSPEDPGDGEVGKTYSTFGRIKNTDWLYSSNYVRVRNITMGYDLGKLIKTKQIQGARLYITAENFFGSDKYDGGFNPESSNTNLSGSNEYPEAGDYGGLPLPKSLILGLNFTF